MARPDTTGPSKRKDEDHQGLLVKDNQFGPTESNILSNFFLTFYLAFFLAPYL